MAFESGSLGCAHRRLPLRTVFAHSTLIVAPADKSAKAVNLPAKHAEISEIDIPVMRFVQ